MTRSGLNPCAETYTIGPYLFECDGHRDKYEYVASRYHDGKVTHNATSPQMVGDVDVTWWTQLPSSSPVFGMEGEQ